MVCGCLYLSLGGALLCAQTVGVQAVLPEFSLCMYPPPTPIFNYAVNLCVVVPITHSGRGSVVLRGCLRKMHRKDGAEEKGRSR